MPDHGKISGRPDGTAHNGQHGMGPNGKAIGTHLSTDTGGTFTDFVHIDEHGVHGFKRLSTPDDPTRCLSRGLDWIGSIASFSHGTTVATNAVLERKGDRTALLTTAGFEDVIFIGRQQRQHLYSFHDLRPSPLIGREDCYGVRERVDRDGSVLVPMDEDEIRDIAQDLVRKGYCSAAVSYLFSFLNPHHEEITERILKESGIRVSRSSSVLPEYREYERTSTTLLDAYVQDTLGSYLSSLGTILDGRGIAAYHVMESEGGVALSGIIARTPSKGLLSGPAGGVSGAIHLGEKIGLPNLITLDMGGTSTDIARITNLRPEYTTDAKISGLPLCRRSLNIVTIGAGGGSISGIDPGGAIKVGPESSGAHPGPVCYGQGGDQVTVTDVNLLAGYFNPKDFLGKRRDLVLPPTKKAVDRLSRKLGYGLEETIHGILRVVDHNMAGALRKVTTEAGKDPAEYALFAFGGAGPVHAVSLARELGMKRILVPFTAGMFSAYGILISDVVHSFSRTRILSMTDQHVREVRGVLGRFAEEGKDLLTNGGIDPDQQRVIPSVDMRYKGQSYSINIPFDDDPKELLLKFQREYTNAYGYSLDGEAEIVNIRLEARGCRFRFPLPEISGEHTNEPYDRKECLFGEWMEVPIFRRIDLGSGFSHSGACIVEDVGSTAVIPSGSKVMVDRHGNLEVRV